MEYKKTYVYLQNAFTLFLTESIDNLRTRKNTAKEKLRKIRIAARLTGHVIKSGFKFYFAYPYEKRELDKSFREFCDELYKTLDKGL